MTSRSRISARSTWSITLAVHDLPGIRSVRCSVWCQYPDDSCMLNLGVGTFGQVRECISQETNETFAVKIIEQDHRGASWGVKSMAREEADLLGSLGMCNVSCHSLIP